MRMQTFQTLRKMIAEDPLTESQIAEISGRDKQQFIGPEDAAEMLQMSRKTLERCAKDLPRVKIGRLVRFRMHDVNQWLNSHTIPGITN